MAQKLEAAAGRTCELSQQIWKGLKWVEEPQIHIGPSPCLTHVVLDSEVRE